MFKRYGVYIFLGLVSSLVGAGGALWIAGPDIILSSQEFDAELKSQIASTLPTMTPSPAPDRWQKIAADATLSSVAIQAFRKNTLIAETSGIILSADGFILTAHEPIARADVIQVVHAQGISRGVVATHDASRNLSLIHIEQENLTVADISPSPVESGQELLLVGGIVDTTERILFSQRGMVSYVSSKTIGIATEAVQQVNGAQVRNDKGGVVGMASLKNSTVSVIASEKIQSFFNDYIKSITQ